MDAAAVARGKGAGGGGRGTFVGGGGGGGDGGGNGPLRLLSMADADVLMRAVTFAGGAGGAPTRLSGVWLYLPPPLACFDGGDGGDGGGGGCLLGVPPATALPLTLLPPAVPRSLLRRRRSAQEDPWSVLQRHIAPQSSAAAEDVLSRGGDGDGGGGGGRG